MNPIEKLKYIRDTEGNEVLQFIDNFVRHATSSYDDMEVLRRTFRSGYCYHFACMLKCTFMRGEVCWAAPFGHIVWEDEDGEVYDVEGVYRGEAQYIIPIRYIEDHLCDFTRASTTGASEGVTKEYIEGAIRRYLDDNTSTVDK